MDLDLKSVLSPFHFSNQPLEHPTERRDFHIFYFVGLKQTLKSIFQLWREKHWLKAASAFNKGLQLQAMGMRDEAEEAYRRCLMYQPDHEPAMVNLAAILFRNGKTQATQVQLQKAIEARPRFYRAYYNLALILKFEGKLERAEELLDRAMDLEENHLPSILACAEICQQKKNYGKALELLQKALDLGHDPPQTLVRISELHFRSMDYTQAENALRQALRYRANAELHYNLAWLSLVQGNDPQEAVQLLSMAEKAKSGFKQAIFNLALAQSMTQAFEDAIGSMLRYTTLYTNNSLETQSKHLMLLFEVNRENIAAKLKIAKLNLQYYGPDDALRVTDEVVAEHPEYSPAHEFRCDLHMQLGHYQEAIEGYEHWIREHPGQVDAYLGLSRVYGKTEQYEKALPVIEKVLELDPDNADIHYQYATLKAEAGELDIAIKHYREVRSIDPEFPKIGKRIAMAEDELVYRRNQEPIPWSEVIKQRQKANS